ncbi:MAG: ABC transporter permease subunit [Chloroflexales bacterium]|nr:ABC transporter permease subunit [Chloroflexales bacterium]
MTSEPFVRQHAARPTAPPRRLLAHLLRHREARIGLFFAALLIGLALFGPLLAPYDPNQPDFRAKLEAPSAEHWLGTDQSGRDQLSRVLDGAQRTLGTALLVLGSIFGIGLLVGTIAGMSGGIVDIVLMRLVDVLMALPSIVLAIAIVGVLGPGFQNLVLALIISWWAYYARLARSYVLNARQRPDIIAARLAGIGWSRIMVGHVLPGVTTQLLIVATLDLGAMITAIAGLSFLGLGVQPPEAEWGAMLSEARLYFTLTPWLLFGPLLPIFFAVLAANLLGNALRDTLDPGRSR